MAAKTYNYNCGNTYEQGYTKPCARSQAPKFYMAMPNVCGFSV